MNTPLDLELRWAWRRDQLLHEAATERLAAAAQVPSVSARARLAAALYALADWIGPRPAHQNAAGPSSA